MNRWPFYPFRPDVRANNNPEQPPHYFSHSSSLHNAGNQNDQSNMKTDFKVSNVRFSLDAIVYVPGHGPFTQYPYSRY